MSIYNTNQGNQLDIRARESTFDSLLVWNPRTERYEHVTPGGGDGEPVTLPYYLENDSIQFTNARGINGAFVQDVDTILNSVLPAHEASLEQLDERLVNVENTILPAHEASLEELDGRVDSNTLAVNNLMPRMTAVEDVNTTQNTNITALQTKTSNINQTASTALTMGYTSTSSMRMQMNSTGLNVYAGLPTANPSSLARVTIKPTSIDFNTAVGGLVYLDLDRVDNLGKYPSVFTADYNNKVNFIKGVTFPGAVETLDTSNKKMIVMDSTTKALSYATIPSGGSGSDVMMYYKPQNVTEGAVGYGEVTRSGEVYALKSGTLTSSNSLYRYNYANHYLFDLADKPFSMSELTVGSGILYAFFIDGLTDNHRLTIDYFRSANDQATVTEITTGVINVPFFSTIVPKKMALVHIFHSSLTGTNLRYLRGKVLINIYDDANNQTAVPTVVVATG